LTGRKSAPPAALDAAEPRSSRRTATVTIRTAQLEKAKVDLGRCTIYSPIDGVVISRDVDVGPDRGGLALRAG
jgi:HlyD family secretion protein